MSGPRKPAAPAGKSSTSHAPLLRLSDEPNRLNRETNFVCSIRFRNDLPEIPCDPKLLLAPLNTAQLAAFRPMAQERELHCDIPFDADVGIPLAPLDIGRWAIPDDPGALHPADAELLQSDDEGGTARTALRGKAGELSWLLRTSYLTSGRDSTVPVRGGAARGAAPAAAAGGEEPETSTRESRIATIEASFEDAQRAPVHATDPTLYPLEVLPVLPDEELAGRNLVLALFESDPLVDARGARGDGGSGATLPPAACLQLKSFAQRREDGSVDRFVACLAPAAPLPAHGGDSEDEPGSRVVPADALQGDYAWLREYDSTVRYDDKNSTYLFRFAGDHVGYHDLNTKLALRKRQRATRADDDEQFLQPEKIVLRLPGSAEDALHDRAAPPSPTAKVAAKEAPAAVAQDAALDDWGSEEEEEEGGAPPAIEGSVLRDAFGNEDDDF